MIIQMEMSASLPLPGTEGRSWSRHVRCGAHTHGLIYVDIYLEQEPVHLRKRTDPKSIVTVVRWPAW